VPACPTLITERLTMRPFRSEDLDPLLAIMTTDEVRAAFHLSDAFSRSDVWSTLTSHVGLWELKAVGQWALEERGSGRFVGRAGLYWRAEPEWPGVEVGWMLDPAVWGRGYATEAGGRAVRHGFEEVGEVALFSVILPGNTRSEAVALRLGFTPGEERVLPHFPSAAHRIWRLDRTAWVGRLDPGPGPSED
jgi:RimJ/RimL family protein N-acetyltransferase